jgi:hypothetical protein
MSRNNYSAGGGDTRREMTDDGRCSQGLARPGCTEKANSLTCGHLERDIVDDPTSPGVNTQAVDDKQKVSPEDQFSTNWQ